MGGVVTHSLKTRLENNMVRRNLLAGIPLETELLHALFWELDGNGVTFDIDKKSYSFSEDIYSKCPDTWSVRLNGKSPFKCLFHIKKEGDFLLFIGERGKQTSQRKMLNLQNKPEITIFITNETRIFLVQQIDLECEKFHQTLLQIDILFPHL